MSSGSFHTGDDGLVPSSAPGVSTEMSCLLTTLSTGTGKQDPGLSSSFESFCFFSPFFHLFFFLFLFVPFCARFMLVHILFSGDFLFSDDLIWFYLHPDRQIFPFRFFVAWDGMRAEKKKEKQKGRGIFQNDAFSSQPSATTTEKRTRSPTLLLE